MEVRRIFTVCGSVAGAMLVLAAIGVFAALQRGVPLQTLAFVVPLVMGAGIATFAVAYAIPVGLVSLKRLEIAYKMGYFGIGQSRETTIAIKQVAERVRRETTPLPVARRPGREE